MAYIISQQPDTAAYKTAVEKYPAINRFKEWATNQDVDNHIAWTGISLTSMAAVFFPLTMAVIVLNGASFHLIITAMVALSLVVIVNLAALPTRYTIPAFFLAILIDAATILASLLGS